MKCPSCGVNLDNGLSVCPECGEKLPDTGKPVPEKKPDSKLAKTLKLIIVLAVLTAAVIIAVLVAVKISAGAGERIAGELSEKIGRSVALAEKNLNLTLSSDSEFSILKAVQHYDYQYSSDKTVKVEGIHLPEWVIFVKTDSEDRITDVIYYDFRCLTKNWKGEKVSAHSLPNDRVEYGMTIREAQKALGFAPLSVAYSQDDTVTYRYKYYYVSEADQNEHAYYLTVEYDLDHHVRKYTNLENEYMASILK